jgi:hypothetical protein
MSRRKGDVHAWMKTAEGKRFRTALEPDVARSIERNFGVDDEGRVVLTKEDLIVSILWGVHWGLRSMET